jgi:hypothetical protein
VAALRAAGVMRIQPGIESLSDHVLDLMRKGTSGLRNVQLLKWCKEYGIKVDWNILYGFPGETREDYAATLAMLPAIEFLDPPVACGQIRMDRFSPYFQTPEKFGLTNVRPMKPYEFLYPFNRESLMRIAYHFDFDYDPGAAPGGYADDVIRFVAGWRQSVARGLLSSIQRTDGTLLLLDTRNCATLNELVLSGVEAEAYAYCDEVHSLTAIVRHMREYLPDAEITEPNVIAFLQSLAANRLMLTDGRHWLSLAVPVNQAAREDFSHALERREEVKP